MTADFEIMGTDGHVRLEGTEEFQTTLFSSRWIDKPENSVGPITQILLPVKLDLQPGETLTLHFNKEGQ